MFPCDTVFFHLFNLGSLMFFFGTVKNHESFTDPALTWNCSQELSASSSWLRKGAEDRQISRLKMDVSKNRGTPTWMMYNGKPY